MYRTAPGGRQRHGEKRLRAFCLAGLNTASPWRSESCQNPATGSRSRTRSLKMECPSFPGGVAYLPPGNPSCTVLVLPSTLTPTPALPCPPWQSHQCCRCCMVAADTFVARLAAILFSPARGPPLSASLVLYWGAAALGLPVNTLSVMWFKDIDTTVWQIGSLSGRWLH